MLESYSLIKKKRYQVVNFIQFLFLFLVLGGCTTVRISDSKGNIRIEKSFGFVSIQKSNDTEAITAEVTSFGYINTPLGHNIGYSNQSIIMSDSSCKVIVWLDDSVSEEQINQLQKISSVCFSK
jgi:hypothetical protein